MRQISALVSSGQASPPPLPRAAGLCALGTIAVAAVTATAGVVLWRGASKRFGATGVALWRGAATRFGVSGVGPAGMHLHATSARPPEVDEAVSVLIAVRHEPDPTVTAVRAALDQRGVEHLDIVVLDDGCPQETRAALRQEFGDDPRVRILAAAPLPRGWSPRAHRSHQLAVAARGRVLIFTEPSAPLGPHAAASVTALLRGGHLDLAVLDIGKKPAASAWASASSTNGSARRDTSSANSGVHDEQARGAGASGGVRPKDGVGPKDRVGPNGGVGPKGGMGPNGGVGPKGRVGPSRGVGPKGGVGRFTVAVDAEAYWRTGGYRAAADDPDPLALLRMVRRASGRVAVADGRTVIPPAQPIAPLPPADATAEAEWDSLHNSRLSLSETARRVLAALVGARP